MLYISSIVSIVEVLIVVVPSLLVVAFITIAERKTMASMQRRLGPNAVGWYGLLQAFADALKLLLKEYVSPTQANIVLFFLGPIITLIFSLLGYAIIPYSPGLAVLDFNLSILYALAVSSLATYGILLAGWSANSKYAFLGSLRSTAQLISYELILSSAILLVVLLVGSLNIGVIVEAQRYVWFIIPLFPIFIIFFIGAVAETNRAPFDLAEAESELVSGFMTEHSAVIFVFFFLAEYASIVLICITTCILFLGGYLLSLDVSDFITSIIRSIYDLLNYFYFSNSNYLPIDDPNSTESYLNYVSFYISDYTAYFYNITNYSLIEGLLNALILGIKSSVMIFIFIWVRASFPRIRFDELMSYCWTVLLPILIAFIVIVPFIIYSFCIIPSNITLLGFFMFFRKKDSEKKNFEKKYFKNFSFNFFYSNYKLILLTVFLIFLFRILLAIVLWLLNIKIYGLLFTDIYDIKNLNYTILFSLFCTTSSKLISAFINSYFNYKLIHRSQLNIFFNEVKKKFSVKSILYIFLFLLFSLSINFLGFMHIIYNFYISCGICLNITPKDKINDIIKDFKNIFKKEPKIPYNFPKQDVILRYTSETQSWAINRINGGKWNNAVSLPSYSRQDLLNMDRREYEFIFSLIRLEQSRPSLSNSNRYELDRLHSTLIEVMGSRSAANNS